MVDNKYKKSTDWLNSSEYISDIESLANEIVRECEHSNSEATTASVFERKIYYILKEKVGVEVEFVKETRVRRRINIDSNEINEGRVDAVVNGLLIEYKHYSKLETLKQYDKAVKQVKEYLLARKGDKNVSYNAILTDGIRICYFSAQGDEIKYTKLKNIEKDDIDLIIRAILANDSKKFVPRNILKDFSISEASCSVSKELALVLYKLLNNESTKKTEMLFTEWKRLVHLSSEDRGKGNDIIKRRKDFSLIFLDSINTPEKEHRALFALQTTYAIIVKLIACKVIDKIDENDGAKTFHNLSMVTSDELQKFFGMIEDGYSYQYHNVVNFLEGDFFSWYADDQQWNEELYKKILEIVKRIDQYSAFSLNVYYEPIDIFKDLYMSIMPKSVRHSMGEYFTPKWLADYVVKEAILINKNDKWKAIDPCCGSGVFLISLIKNIVGDTCVQTLSMEEKNRLKEEILQRVYGIDINPLSVLSARVGYYLALRPFGDVENIEIPVYLGDSAILAENEVIDDIECYKYSILNEKENFDVVLPVRFVGKRDFGTIMNSWQIHVTSEDAETLSNDIIENYNDLERNSSELVRRAKDMAIALTQLHAKNWDGIWIRIATNYMKVAKLSDFDIIIGNPPWVKWEHLPYMYAQKIKELCDIRHIFSGAGQYGGTQLNICALIANVTATNWLAQDGVLAFLMPDSIMSQNSYEEFRNFYLDYEKGERLFLQKIDRWQAPLRPFRCDNKPVTQDFNTYYYSRNEVNYKKGIPVKCITRKKNVTDEELNLLENFEDIKKNLVFDECKALQLSGSTSAFSYSSTKYDFSKIIGETAYKYRTGVEFTPQELYMLKGAGESDKRGYYRFYNKKFNLSKYTIDETPKNGWIFPTNIIYPIITGPHIEAFKYNSDNEYCILPYTKSNTKEPISRAEMKKNNIEIYNYLSRFKGKIDEQSEKSKQMHRGDEFYALSKIGPYTFGKYIVAARDNSKFCSSVIYNQKTPWGEIKNTICVKHTIIISQDLTGRFIGEDEAHYICGILNSEIVQQYIQTCFKSNGYSLNKSKICIPLYDKKNKLHRKIAKIAKDAARQEGVLNLEKIQSELMGLYLRVCDEVNVN